MSKDLRKQYPDFLFEKDKSGSYECFFAGCGQRMRANFHRHVARHAEANDMVDSSRVEQRRAQHSQRAAVVGSSVFSHGTEGGPRKMCTHEDHDTLFPELPRLQPVNNFYSHSTKCKKCYIHLQSERMRRVKSGLPPPRVEARKKRQEELRREELARAAAADVAAAAAAAAAAALGELQSASGAATQAANAARRAAAARERRCDAVSAALAEQRWAAAPPAQRGQGLLHAAVATAHARAAVEEVRELGRERCREELEELEPELLEGALQPLEGALENALTRAALRLPAEEGVHVAALLNHARRRIADARAAVRIVSEGGGCGACGQQEDPSPNGGAPVLCGGSCARVFHNGCAGTPDEQWVCEDCRAGTVVVHEVRTRDGARHVMYTPDMRVAAPPGTVYDERGPWWKAQQAKQPGETLGSMLRTARLNQMYLAKEKEDIERATKRSKIFV